MKTETEIRGQRSEVRGQTKRPIDIACQLYKRAGLTEERFTADLADHLRNAFVVSSPSCFIMFRAVILDDGRHAWFVSSAVGRSLLEFVTQAPFKLECVAFHRRGNPKLRVYDFDRVLKLAMRQRR